MQNFNFNINPLNLNDPIQQIMELNQKALKKFAYLEPQELTQLHGPQALLEKNMKIFIENGHASLDYISQLFNILENSWINLSDDVEDKSMAFLRQTQSAHNSAMNTLSRAQSKAAHSHSVTHPPRKRTSRSSPKNSGTHAGR
ncbi:MAG: hypothetical protein P4L79_01590 [Legionella sp.]|uniref:hypothetical protein n=1 Tax=Legionella sp. TaxID=459 RepID=UPI002846C8C4|nr:hypothetical protein [Legionella sp.]